MSRQFVGRPVLAGNVVGEALVTRRGFNNLACFYQSLLTGSNRAVCSDRDNEDLFGKDMTGKIICLPQSIGSTSAGATWHLAAKRGIVPRAMLFAHKIDSMAAAGLVMAEVWVGQRVYTVDQLGDDFLRCVKDGDAIEVRDDGVVIVH